MVVLTKSASGCPFSMQSTAALAKLKAELRRLAAHAVATLKDALLAICPVAHLARNVRNISLMPIMLSLAPNAVWRTPRWQAIS